MKHFLTILFIAPLFIYAQSWITSVTTSPNPVNDCDTLVVTVNGNLASSNCTYLTSHSIIGNTINVDIQVSCGGLGLPVITPYTATIPIGQVPSNVYTLNVNQFSAGNLQETRTSALNVGSCCPAVANISNLFSSNCIGEATSFIDGGTISDSLYWTDNGVPFYPSSSALGWIHIFSDTGEHNIVLTAQDSSGCLDTIQLYVMVNALPIISVSSTPATCNTCMDGEALVTVLSGPTPHLVVWSLGGTSNPIVGLNPGDYGLTLTDGNMCSVSDSVTVGNSVGLSNQWANILIYPNPTTGFVELKGINGQLMVDIYDNLGRFIKSSNSSFINLSDQPKGLYLIKVFTDEYSNEYKIFKD